MDTAILKKFTLPWISISHFQNEKKFSVFFILVFTFIDIITKVLPTHTHTHTHTHAYHLSVPKQQAYTLSEDLAIIINYYCLIIVLEDFE